MEAGLAGLGRMSRSMSMEDADAPKRSFQVQSPLSITTSPSTSDAPLK